MTNEKLIQKAKKVTKLAKLSDETVALEVGSALITDSGRCREIIFQVNHQNTETDVILEKDRTLKIKDLLPER